MSEGRQVSEVTYAEDIIIFDGGRAVRPIDVLVAAQRWRETAAKKGWSLRNESGLIVELNVAERI